MLLQMVRGGAMKGGPAHGRTREHRQHCGGRAQAAARRTRGSNHGCIPRRTRKRICPPSRYGFTANTWLILSIEKKFFFGVPVLVHSSPAPLLCEEVSW